MELETKTKISPIAAAFNYAKKCTDLTCIDYDIINTVLEDNIIVSGTVLYKTSKVYKINFKLFEPLPYDRYQNIWSPFYLYLVNYILLNKHLTQEYYINAGINFFKKLVSDNYKLTTEDFCSIIMMVANVCEKRHEGKIFNYNISIIDYEEEEQRKHLAKVEILNNLLKDEAKEYSVKELARLTGLTQIKIKALLPKKVKKIK